MKKYIEFRISKHPSGRWTLMTRENDRGMFVDYGSPLFCNNNHDEFMKEFNILREKYQRDGYIVNDVT
jgi:hypothetical protein